MNAPTRESSLQADLKDVTNRLHLKVKILHMNCGDFLVKSLVLTVKKRFTVIRKVPVDSEVY